MQNTGCFQAVLFVNDKGFHGMVNGEIYFVHIHCDKELKNIDDTVNN
jgi:hypothetical protein